MNLFIAFSIYLYIRTSETFLNRKVSIQSPTTSFQWNSRPLIIPSRSRRLMSQAPKSSIMPRPRYIPQESRIPRLSNVFDGPRNMAPQMNPYYWSVRYVPRMTPLWSVFSGKKSSSSSSSSGSSSSEENSRELKLNLQNLSRDNKNFPKDKQNIEKLVNKYGVRYIQHAPTINKSDDSSSEEKGK